MPALRTNIAWKATAGLALTDEAFHPTVLTLWRNKLRASDDPERIFHAVRAVIAECGVIARRHRRALDSTVMDDAVARQDTLTMLATQIRRVRKLIPALQTVWVRKLRPASSVNDNPSAHDGLGASLEPRSGADMAEQFGYASAEGPRRHVKVATCCGIVTTPEKLIQDR